MGSVTQDVVGQGIRSCSAIDPIHKTRKNCVVIICSIILPHVLGQKQSKDSHHPLSFLQHEIALNNKI